MIQKFQKLSEMYIIESCILYQHIAKNAKPAQVAYMKTISNFYIK